MCIHLVRSPTSRDERSIAPRSTTGLKMGHQTVERVPSFAKLGKVVNSAIGLACLTTLRGVRGVTGSHRLSAVTQTRPATSDQSLSVRYLQHILLSSSNLLIPADTRPREPEIQQRGIYYTVFEWKRRGLGGTREQKRGPWRSLDILARTHAFWSVLTSLSAFENLKLNTNYWLKTLWK